MALVTNVHTPVNIEDRKRLEIQAGDTVRVMQKIQEGDKTRLQPFEGVVLARKHGNEAGATFTVRRVVDGIGVEKIFPLYSPMIDSIEILRRAKVRRSKLYYIREKAASQIRRQMRRMIDIDLKTTGEPAPDEMSGEESEEAKGNKESSSEGDKGAPEEKTNLEENMEDASVGEVKEQINTDDPEKSDLKQAEEKTEDTEVATDAESPAEEKEENK